MGQPLNFQNFGELDQDIGCAIYLLLKNCGK
jgi:hypothetical protein